jgi:hypothetical protein
MMNSMHSNEVSNSGTHKHGFTGPHVNA